MDPIIKKTKGKRKISIEKIEKKSRMQVTFTKRRNGLLKKCYELSTLCNIDLALLIFSPTMKLTLFSGKKSVEDILTRILSLPEHNRKGLGDVEDLRRSLEKMKNEYALASQMESDESIIQNLQAEIEESRYNLEEVDKKLRLYEGEHIRLNSLSEVESTEKLLQETLNRVRMLQQTMNRNHDLPNEQPITENENNHGLLASNPIHYLDWIQSQNNPQLQFMNSFDSNGLLDQMRNQANPSTNFQPPAQTPVQLVDSFDSNGFHDMRNQGDLSVDFQPPAEARVQIMNSYDSNELLPIRNQESPSADFLPPAQTPFDGNNASLAAHMDPTSEVANSSQAHHEVVGPVDANLPQSTEHYPTVTAGVEDGSRFEEQGEDSLMEHLLTDVFPELQQLDAFLSFL